ncbi:MAG TPA: phosphodiesterase [Firmicutes bacterium]|nr:phosphodiesterase [Bacillota bacterium]
MLAFRIREKARLVSIFQDGMNTMRKMAIAEIKPGMKLAKTIYRNDDGRILLSAKSEIKESHIQRLLDYNYEFAVVYDNDIEFEEETVLKPIKEETRSKAVALLKQSVKHIKTDGFLECEDLVPVIQEIIEYILADPLIVYNMVAIRNHDSYTFSHSVNVCVIASLIGSVMGFDRNELQILGIGAMLHDIGKVRIELKILNKKDPLETYEFDLMKAHPLEGYEILRQSVHMSYLPAHVALQHHEREDGSGYPKRLKGTEIHLFAKIVAVADVFDAMTSERVYKAAAPAYIAYQEIADKAGIQFYRPVVEALTKVITPYPKGSMWLLSNGDKVIVTNVTRLDCLAIVVTDSTQSKVYNLYKPAGIRVIQKMN